MKIWNALEAALSWSGLMVATAEISVSGRKTKLITILNLSTPTIMCPIGCKIMHHGLFFFLLNLKDKWKLKLT